MRTENFEIRGQFGADHAHLIIDKRSLDRIIIRKEDLQELYDLFGRYLGNLTHGGKTDLDLREDAKG